MCDLGDGRVVPISPKQHQKILDTFQRMASAYDGFRPFKLRTTYWRDKGASIKRSEDSLIEVRKWTSQFLQLFGVTITEPHLLEQTLHQLYRYVRQVEIQEQMQLAQEKAVRMREIMWQDLELKSWYDMIANS